MKTFWNVLGALGFLSGAAFLALFIPCWARLLPWELAHYSLGVMQLITGVFAVREAADSGRWARSVEPIGRLTLFAIGLAFCAGGVAFLGRVWLTDTFAGLSLFGAVAAGIVLALVGQQLDKRGYEASRVAIRRRGWLLASCRTDDDLSADEVRWRRQAREALRQAIQEHVTGRTTRERIEAQHRYLVEPERDRPFPIDSPDVADEWRGFRSTAKEIDELWAFNTVSAQNGGDCGEKGFALLRDGRVVDWFITDVVG
jgi:hypothetical protein